MKLFDYTLRLKGFDINEARLLLNNIQNTTGTAFEKMIFQERQNILNYHLNHNAFYNKFIGNTIPNNWNSIPILKKSDLQLPLENILSSTFKKKDVYIDKTSGASGHPFYFAKDKFCHALTWAIIQDRFGWYNIDFNSSKQARFYVIPLDKKGYYMERLKDVLAHRFRFSVFDMSDEAFDKMIEKFKNTPFYYINGYTTPIVQFAKYLKKKNIVLTNLCPSLKVCIVTSEMLFHDDRKLMESQFGVPIVNEYGASELDLIAFENPKGEWQINSETLYVEILDDNNDILPYGSEGRIVITSLFNKAFPMIRYDIGDIGVLSTSSTIKKPVLKKLIGRSNDIIVLPSGKKAAGLTFYYVTKSIIENGGKVKEFVIDQTKINHFKITYVAENKLSETEEKLIEEAVKVYLEDDIIISFDKKNSLKRSNSGKLKQFTSQL